MYGWMMGGAGALWWVFGLLAVLLIAALVVILVVTLTRRSTPESAGVAGPGMTARRILDERYARGEIDHDEYVRRRDDLAPGDK
jgi:putative membrane protein